MPSRATLAKRFLTFLAILALPALLAPFVSENPVRWAYRVYHPFMYRYPVRFPGVAHEAELLSRDMSPLEQSLSVVGIMIENW